jgi:hypothetical protein
LLNLYLTRGPQAVEVVANPLPEDARLVDIRLDRDYGVIELLISSASYAEVAEGDLPPVMPDPVFRSL